MNVKFESHLKKISDVKRVDAGAAGGLGGCSQGDNYAAGKSTIQSFPKACVRYCEGRRYPRYRPIYFRIKK